MTSGVLGWEKNRERCLSTLRITTHRSVSGYLGKGKILAWPKRLFEFFHSIMWFFHSIVRFFQ